MADIQKRKAQHIDLAMAEGSQVGRELFSDFLLPYRALPEMNLADVDTSVKLFGKGLSQPLIIASMTGGSLHAEKINTNLAMACEEMKVAMGVGSQRVALEKEDAKVTFQLVRKMAPSTVIFANMGAVQLNYGHSVESYRRVVDMIEADGLYLHINPMQEALQPEGDTNWQALLKKIETLVKKVGAPVWVKEVGNGLDSFTIAQLVGVGVSGIDVAGVGGTSWTWIEGRRRDNPRLTEWFKDFGVTTERALAGAVSVRGESKKKFSITASGGIRTPIQGLKANMLGADFYSAARPFLEPAMESPEKVIEVLKDWEYGLRVAMFGVGKIKW